MTSQKFGLVCFVLVLIVSTVLSQDKAGKLLSQDECDKPAIFTNKSSLDKYIRCLKAKAGPRYGKRMTPSIMIGKLKPRWFVSGQPSNDDYYQNLYRMFHTSYEN